MTRLTAIALAAAVAMTAACGNFEIQNIDNPSLNTLEGSPTPSVIYSATQGLLAGIRSSTTSNLSTFAHYGRIGYYIDVAQTRLTAFDDVLTPGGGAGWGGTYGTIRVINTINAGLDKVGSAMTDAEKAAVRGFVWTVEAYVLHGQLRAQDAFGIATDTDHPRSAALPPIVSKAAGFSYIAKRLDDARTQLQAAGATFPFTLGTGFAGFNTPATFTQFNRALRARAAIEAGAYADALTALAASFVSATAAMDLGPRNVYSTTSGDATNGFFDPSGFSYVADSMLPRQAQLQPGGAVDLRVSTKMTQMSVYRTHTGVTSNYRWTRYPTSTSPIPIIKNEELLLIRAEARWRTGDQPGALADLNTVRTVSGGLAAIGAWPGDPAFENELLYNRKYSLMLEYGHRWVDLRRFGRLTDLTGPRGPGDLVFDKVPLPQTECDQREETDSTPRCSQVSGFPTAA